MTKRKPSYAAPLKSILMMQCSERRLFIMSSDYKIFDLEVKKAEAVYRKYLQRHDLICAEFYPCIGQGPRRGCFEQEDSNASVR